MYGLIFFRILAVDCTFPIDKLGLMTSHTFGWPYTKSDIRWHRSIYILIIWG